MAPHRPALKSQLYFSPSAAASVQRSLSAMAPTRTKEELLALVGSYDDESAQEHFEFLRDIYRRGYAQPYGPNITVSNNQIDVNYPRPSEVLEDDEEAMEIADKLSELLWVALSKPDLFSPVHAYELYTRLPQPRMLRISAMCRHRLMHWMVEYPTKTHAGMLRYFELVKDVKNAGLSMTTKEWNNAIAYAGQYAAEISDIEVEATLVAWKNMEQKAGVQGNEATFNILFDVASKAGNFALAEMLYREMVDRGLEFNRYHHVSLIYYFGLKMDAGGVRAAYREMVESGEMIDSTVMNCVMSSFIKCGDEGEAEAIYQRMKSTVTKTRTPPVRNYFTQRVITKVLMMQARMAKLNPKAHSLLQGQTSLAPDLQTYRILIKHFAEVIGDLPRVTRYIDEMALFGVPLHGAIFLALFKGFFRHGGYSGTDWSLKRLQSVYEAFIRHCDEPAYGLYVTRWMAMAIVRAFAKCSLSRPKVIEVYTDLRLRWDLDAQQMERMEEMLHKTMKYWC